MRLFSGQRAWVLQRITALILIAGVISGSALLLFAGPISYAQWKGFFAGGHGATLTLLCFAATGLHGWIGARDVILDYVPQRIPRLALLSLIAVLLVASTIRLGLVIAAQVSR